MHQRHTQAYLTQEQRFNDRFPVAIVAVLAVIQMLATFSIIAFEIGHIIIDIRLTNLFVGFWASLPFTILWISMFATVCCCRRRNCATHAVVQNFISFIFASALIGINIVFIRRPNQCFFSGKVCKNLSWIDEISFPFECYFDDNSNGCGKTRLALIKAQLAAGVILAVTCFIYLIVYYVVASRVNRRQVPTIADSVMAPVYQQPPPTTRINYQHQPYTISSQPFQPSAPVMMPTYPQVPPQNNNVNYFPSNQYPAIYPQIPNDRF